MKKNILTVFLLISVLSIRAQVSFEKRIEFELKNGYSKERIVEFGNDGFILYSQSTKSDKGQKEWKYDLYNTDLVLEKTKSVYMDKAYFADETWVGNNRVHTLFKTKRGDYILYAIDSESLQETKVQGKLPRKTFVKDMAVIGDYAIFNAFVKHNKFLYSINWKTGKANIIPVHISGYSNKKLKLTHFQVLEETNEIFIYVKALQNKSNSDIYIIRLNDEGKKQEIYKLTANIETNIVSVSASPLGNDKFIFTGTYSDKRTYTSEGLFFCEAEKEKINFIEYYKFTNLENFFKYLPERKQKKIEKKKNRKEAHGKKLKYNYLIAEHAIIQMEDGYSFLGEAYFPTYRSESYTVYIDGKAVTRHRLVFDGYQYTHAILAKFDKEGKMIWDQVFEMWPSYKPYYVKRFISLAEGKQDGIHLVFANRGRITSKSFDFDGNIKTDKTSEQIKTNFEDDMSKRSFSNLNYWYDNYFIAYGSQKIKNYDGNNKRKRKIYFISKVRYE